MAYKKEEKTGTPLVSIVILNWNGLEDTIACINSVDKLTYKNVELIVVDNGSERPISDSDIKTDHRVTLIKNEVNKGFAGGEISALPYCNGAYIFLLNNDAVIDKDAVTEAVNTFELDDSIAVVGGRSYSLHEDSRESFAYYSYQYIDPVTAETHTYDRDDGIQDVATVSGSAVMIKKSVIDEYGYFDERFFAYYEETDLFARYLRAGKRIVYNPNVIIWHKDGASTKNKRYMYYYLMLKNQFLFAFKNFDSDALRQFLKVYLRNFRRSLWLYIKNRSKAEGVHKARVRSTIWNLVNIFNTVASRKKTFKINPDFSYTKKLFTAQPIRATIVIDARDSINPKSLFYALEKLISLPSHPSEILVITSKKVSLPTTTHDTVIRNIVDKHQNKLTAYDFGFMSSNTELLFFTEYERFLKLNDKLTETIVNSYCLTIESEAAVVVKKFSGSDLKIANGSNSAVIAIRKPDLVNFLDIHDNIHSINPDTFGQFINWLTMDCRPIARIQSPSTLLEMLVTSPKSTHSTLNNPVRWRFKKIIRTLHFARIINVFRKRLLKASTGSHESGAKLFNPSKFPIYKDGARHNTPIFINTRDRIEPLLKLINWLEKGKYTNIIFIDNDSTYPELIKLFETTPYQVIPLGRNGMHRSPWESFAVRFIAKNKPYVVTDPDIIPTSNTPTNTISYLYDVLEKYPTYVKAGVALKINDLPDHYSLKQSVIDWESRYWDKDLLLEKDLYKADLDTTLALYHGGSWWSLSPSIRVAGKYTMHHEPWYQNLDDPTEDMLYYKVRASNDVSTWTKGKLPKHHIRALNKEGFLESDEDEDEDEEN